MKKSILLLTAITFSITLIAQEKTFTPKLGLKFAPTGLVVGSLSLQGEYNFGRNSLTAKIGLPLSVKHSFEYEDKDAEFNKSDFIFGRLSPVFI